VKKTARSIHADDSTTRGSPHAHRPSEKRNTIGLRHPRESKSDGRVRAETRSKACAVKHADAPHQFDNQTTMPPRPPVTAEPMYVRSFVLPSRRAWARQNAIRPGEKKGIPKKPSRTETKIATHQQGQTQHQRDRGRAHQRCRLRASQTKRHPFHKQMSQRGTYILPAPIRNRSCRVGQGRLTE